jgi:hypothetical protein
MSKELNDEMVDKLEELGYILEINIKEDRNENFWQVTTPNGSMYTADDEEIIELYEDAQNE